MSVADQLGPYESYGSTWSIRLVWINLICIILISSVILHTITDHLYPTWSVCITLSPTSNADLLNPYVDQLKHITNQKRSRNQNPGENRLTSTSTVEHSPIHVFNVVNAKLQSTTQRQTRMKKKTMTQEEAEWPKKRSRRRVAWEKEIGRRWVHSRVREEEEKSGALHICFKKLPRGYFCPLT